MKSVIIYYSYGGNTKKIADMIRRETGCKAAEIRVAVPYPDDYDTVVNQGQEEVNRGFMPEILPLEENPEEYDEIFLGMPVWWYTYAPAVKTFLTKYRLAGKRILPFATNGGWIGHTAKDLKSACPDSEVGELLNIRFDGAELKTPEKKILEWIKRA